MIRLAALALLLATPTWAEVPGVSPQEAYGLIRTTLLDFEGGQPEILARLASQPGGSWDDLPLLTDPAQDPGALRLVWSTERNAGGESSMAARQVDCVRLGPKGLAAIRAGQTLTLTRAPGATADPALDAAEFHSSFVVLEAFAEKPRHWDNASVMMCNMMIALTPGDDPAKALVEIARPDFVEAKVTLTGGLHFDQGIPAPGGWIDGLNGFIEEIEGQPVLNVTVFSVRPSPGS